MLPALEPTQGGTAGTRAPRAVLGASDPTQIAAAGPRADVGEAGADALADRIEEVAVLQLLQQAERVAAADEERVGAVELIERDDVELHLRQPVANLGDVRVVIECRERDEGDDARRSEEVAKERLDVVEEAIAVDVRAGVEEEAHGGRC